MKQRSVTDWRPPLLAALLLAAAPLAAGCGSEGRAMHHVSGRVTYAGSPVPAGIIIFDPAVTEGNDGLQGYAEIRAGRYNTSRSGRGISGGRYRVRIRGFAQPDGSDARLRKLFDEHTIAVELPNESTDRDFAVPASAGGSDASPLPPPE